MFNGPFDESIVKRAKAQNLIDINIHDLRDWAKDNHKTVDDRPFSGGFGMVMKVDVLHDAVIDLVNKVAEKKFTTEKRWPKDKYRVILMDPKGEKFSQKKAEEYSKLQYLQIICGHYEGVDERVTEHIVDEIISVGDFVLTGGEIPAMAITDSIVRLLPGVLKEGVTGRESFQVTDGEQFLEYPQYTRPSVFKGWKVPEVLLKGNHKEIEEWKKKEALKKTKSLRPDLIK